MKDPNRKKKVTIYDVAKQAAVSTATVSRVINKSHTVDPETLKKVEKAIKATGYYPNAIAQTMRSNASFSIGFVMADLSNNHFTLMATTINRILEKRNYNLIVCSSHGSRESERNYLRALMSKKVDGLVIHTNGENDAVISELSRQVPVALVYRKIENDNFAGDFVGSEDFNGAYKLGRHVLAHGHTRISVINGSTTLSTGRERFAGFLLAMNEAGVKIDPDLIYADSYQFESGEVAMQKILEVPARPTVIVALSNALAMGAMTCLRDRHIRIPEDVSFASFGELANPKLLFVKPTVVNQYPERVGEIAAELLLRRIADPARPPEMIYVPSLLETGSSLVNAPTPPLPPLAPHA